MKSACSTHLPLLTILPLKSISHRSKLNQAERWKRRWKGLKSFKEQIIIWGIQALVMVRVNLMKVRTKKGRVRNHPEEMAKTMMSSVLYSSNKWGDHLLSLSHGLKKWQLVLKVRHHSPSKISLRNRKSKVMIPAAAHPMTIMIPRMMTMTLALLVQRAVRQEIIGRPHPPNAREKITIISLITMIRRNTRSHLGHLPNYTTRTEWDRQNRILEGSLILTGSQQRLISLSNTSRLSELIIIGRHR